MKLTVSVTRFSDAGQAACSLELDLDEWRTGHPAEKADRERARERIRKAYALVQWAADDQLARMAAVPAHAAPEHTPVAEERGKLHPSKAGGAHPPGTDRRPPTTGKQLFGWVRNQEERLGQPGLLRYLNGWGKLQEFPLRMIDWDGPQVAEGYAEGCRKLAEIAAAPEELKEEVRP